MINNMYLEQLNQTEERLTDLIYAFETTDGRKGNTGNILDTALGLLKVFKIKRTVVTNSFRNMTDIGQDILLNERYQDGGANHYDQKLSSQIFRDYHYNIFDNTEIPILEDDYECTSALKESEAENCKDAHYKLAQTMEESHLCHYKFLAGTKREVCENLKNQTLKYNCTDNNSLCSPVSPEGRYYKGFNVEYLADGKTVKRYSLQNN
ncbi:unnamed protein product [Moneuplotes crassus]|uniref:Uncharacterized protein n=1 Tax=Euplotes crassus TaxID=5936 RepID=A0AAD2D3T2_EUPCR|nr:unnamed protein product [Moneuplotes crassus]